MPGRFDLEELHWVIQPPEPVRPTDVVRWRSGAVDALQLAAVRGERVFSDGWDHEVLVEKITPIERGATSPRLLAGRRRCPPEDCGGPWCYAEMLAALADVAHERHRELSESIGASFDPEQFDVEAVNEAMDAVRRD